jgi:hypothetical protein
MKTAAGLLVLFFFISVAVLVLNDRPVHAGRVLKRNIMSKQTHKNPSDHPNLLIEEVHVAPSGPNPGGNKYTQSISEGLNSDHPNLLIEEVDVAPSGPNPGGNKYTQSISEGLNSDHPNLLIEEVDVAPSGPNPGGNKYTQSISEGLNYVHADKLNTQFQKGHVLPCGQRLSKLVDGDHELGDILNGKLPSAASPGVGHKYIISFGPLKMKTSDAAISASTSKQLKINKLPSGPSGGVGHKYINVVGPMNTNKLSVKPAKSFITTTTFNKLPSGPSDGVGHKYVD